MASPLFTIMVPTVNRLQLLGRALDSALAQDEPAQVVVSDNGSSDGTPEWLATITHPRLTKLRHEPTLPAPAHARLQHAVLTTEWVVFLSDDDYLEPGFIAALTRCHEAHPEARILYSQAQIHMWDDSYAGKPGPAVEPGWQFLLAFLRGERNPCWCAMAVRTEDLRTIGWQPHDRHIGDMYYWVRIAAMGPVACVAAPLSHYIQIRESTDNITSAIRMEAWMDESRALAREMTEVILAQAGDQAPSARTLDRLCGQFLALTCGNQVLWNAVRGRSRRRIWAEVAGSLASFAFSPSAWPRILGGAFLPRSVIRAAIQRFVARAYQVPTGPTAL